MGSIEEYNASIAATRALLSQTPEMRDFIRYATLAANSHNTQPRQFRISEGDIEILPDFSRRIPVVDPDDHHIFASLDLTGCPMTTSLVPLHDSRRARHVCEKLDQFPSTACYRGCGFLVEDSWLPLELLGRG